MAEERQEERRLRELEWKTKSETESRLQEAALTQIRLAEEANRIAMSTQDRLQAEREKVENRLKRASEVMRSILYPFPSDPTKSLPMYFNNIERLFEIHHIDEDLKVPLLNPLLPEKARNAILAHDPADVESYARWKQILLKEYRLSPTSYRKDF